jgi:hypothetical protein
MADTFDGHSCSAPDGREAGGNGAAQVWSKTSRAWYRALALLPVLVLLGFARMLSAIAVVRFRGGRPAGSDGAV